MGVPHFFYFTLLNDQSMDHQRLTGIQALIEPIVAGQNAELVELTCRPQGRQLLIRLLVDKVGGSPFSSART